MLTCMQCNYCKRRSYCVCCSLPWNVHIN